MKSIFGLLALLAALPASRARAAEQFARLDVRQEWCADGSFRFRVNGRASLAPEDRSCVILARGELEFPIDVKVDQVVDGPVGNFLDRLFATALDRPDMSYRGAPTEETHEFWVRAGTCGTTSVIAIQAVTPSLLPDGLNLDRDLCYFPRSVRLTSRLPLAGVYPREGRSLGEFIKTLTK